MFVICRSEGQVEPGAVSTGYRSSPTSVGGNSGAGDGAYDVDVSVLGLDVGVFDVDVSGDGAEPKQHLYSDEPGHKPLFVVPVHVSWC